MPETTTKPAAPDPEAAVAAAAESSDITPSTQATLADFFLGRVAPPGKDSVYPVEVDMGTPDAHNMQTVQMAYLRPEDFERAAREAERKDAEGNFEGVDLYVQASWIFASAIRQPALGPMLQQRNEQARAEGLSGFANTAQLVQEVFAWQPGTLLQAADIVRRRSRQGNTDDRAAREVEAGKTSR